MFSRPPLLCCTGVAGTSTPCAGHVRGIFGAGPTREELRYNKLTDRERASEHQIDMRRRRWIPRWYLRWSARYPRAKTTATIGFGVVFIFAPVIVYNVHHYFTMTADEYVEWKAGARERTMSKWRYGQEIPVPFTDYTFTMSTRIPPEAEDPLRVARDWLWRNSDDKPPPLEPIGRPQSYKTNYDK